MVFKTVGSAASQPERFFKGIVNFLVGTTSGKLFASTRGQEFIEVNTNTFDTSSIKDLKYFKNINNYVSENYKKNFNSIFDNNNTGLSWITINSNFNTIKIDDIIYGRNIWIACGDSGQLRISTDTTTWSTIISNFATTNINSISYGNNSWMIVGQSGQMRTSTNGLLWTTVTSNFATTDINSISYGNNLWTAVGNSGQMRSSTNGISWLTITSNFATTNILKIVFQNNLWTAVGNSGQMRSSTNGISWLTITSNFDINNINSISYGNNLWIAVGQSGQMRTSINLIDWTTVTSNFDTTNINSIAYFNNLWIASGDSGQIRKSTNGITWTTATSNFDINNINSISYGSNLWIAIGNNGQMRKSEQFYINYSDDLFSVGNSGKIRSSTDGINWTTVNNQSNLNINIINYNNKIYNIEDESFIANLRINPVPWTVPSFCFNLSNDKNTIWAATGSGIMSSTDAITWSTISSTNTSKVFQASNTMYGAVEASSVVKISTNAIFWTSVNTKGSGAASGDLIFGGGYWVFGAGATIRISTDGYNWDSSPSIPASTNVVALAYGQGVWVAGLSGTTVAGGIRRSTNAINWVTQTNNIVGINKIVYNNGVWVATGRSSGTLIGMRRSIDAGQTWTTVFITSGTAPSGDFTGITYSTEESLWFATTNYAPGLYKSTDAISWVTINNTPSLGTVEYFKDKLMFSAIQSSPRKKEFNLDTYVIGDN